MPLEIAIKYAARIISFHRHSRFLVPFPLTPIPIDIQKKLTGGPGGPGSPGRPFKKNIYSCKKYKGNVGKIDKIFHSQLSIPCMEIA